MKSEVSRNVLLIALAVRLQRLVKNLPNRHISAERISRKSLAEAYLCDGLSNSEEGARKKASRYMDEMERIFGLGGSESSGYVMDRKFSTFRDMFEFWLEKISPPGKDDKRLHVMLQGLIHAIDNAFSEDPIVVTELAKQLKSKYGNKNIRDTREPLHELFDNSYIGSLLSLGDIDDDSMCINTNMDPLLLRLKPRSEVGDNHDISINLARPGRIHVIFDHTLTDLDQGSLSKVRSVAEAVCNSDVWKINDEEYLPYILYREGKGGKIMLTMRNLSQGHFEETTIDDMQEAPASEKQYIPFDIDARVWASFKQMAG